MTETSFRNLVIFIPTNHNNMYKWVRSLRSLHPLGSLCSLQLLRVWLTLASLGHSHGRDELATFSYSECGLRSLQLLRVWVTLALLAHSHRCDEVGRERD